MLLTLGRWIRISKTTCWNGGGQVSARSNFGLQGRLQLTRHRLREGGEMRLILARHTSRNHIGEVEI